MTIGIQSGTLVLDFDGVVFRNEKANALVNYKSIKFVSKKMNTSYNYAFQVHKQNFKKSCHTVHMLNKLGYATELDEYNTHVFNNDLWKELKTCMHYTDTQNIKTIIDTNEKLEKKSVLFSNAPESWCENVLHLNGYSIEDLFEDTYTCTNLDELKPNVTVYNKIESKYDKLYFIDDTEINLLFLSEKWNTYLLGKNDKLQETLKLVVHDMFL